MRFRSSSDLAFFFILACCRFGKSAAISSGICSLQSENSVKNVAQNNSGQDAIRPYNDGAAASTRSMSRWTSLSLQSLSRAPSGARGMPTSMPYLIRIAVQGIRSSGSSGWTLFGRVLLHMAPPQPPHS